MAPIDPEDDGWALPYTYTKKDEHTKQDKKPFWSWLSVILGMLSLIGLLCLGLIGNQGWRLGIARFVLAVLATVGLMLLVEVLADRYNKRKHPDHPLDTGNFGKIHRK